MKYGQPMISSETRRLLVTIAVSIALLWVLARIRFHESTAPQTAVAPVLAQLRPAANYDDLARAIADVRPIVAAAVVPVGAGTAFRISSDRAVTLHPDEGMSVIATDRATQLAVVSVAAAEPAGVIPWMPRVLDYPRFFLVGERTIDRVTVRPVFVGTLAPAISPYWESEVWHVPTGVDLPAGRFVFTTEGALAGLSIVESEHSAIVPAAQLLRAAQRIAEAPPGPEGTIGVDVLPLSPALAAAAGTKSGVIVSMVDPAGAAADLLAPTDVVEAVDGHTIGSIDDWRARVLRIEAGETVSLRVRAEGQIRDVQVTAIPASAPALQPDAHGLGLQLAPASSGSRVVGVQPGSSGAHASLQPGDLITAVGRQMTPTPSQVARAFAALPPGETLIVAFTRGTTHQLAPLRKTRPEHAMTGWSISAMLLIGIAAGPYGLQVLSPAVLSLLDPGIVMGLAMLGVFVGLSFNPRRRPTVRSVAASLLRTCIVMTPVAVSVYATLLYLEAPANHWWDLPIVLGACAAVSEAATDANTDDVLMIGVAALVMAALRDTDPSSVGLMAGALAVVAVLVAFAGWLLVGQTSIEAEQHVFVVGSLLVAGGAAAYLGMSALLAGLVVGAAWNIAGGVAKPRITRDLHYFQHPLVVLVLVVAGAHATLSIEAFALAAVFIAVRAIARSAGAWAGKRLTVHGSVENSLIAAGLIGVAIALDIYQIAPDIQPVGTIVGTVVIATIGSSMVGAFVHSSVPEVSIEPVHAAGPNDR